MRCRQDLAQRPARDPCAGPGLGVIEHGAVAAPAAASPSPGRRPSCRPAWMPRERIDCDGRWITPGLIDCHTHLVYAGDRATSSSCGCRREPMRRSRAPAAASSRPCKATRAASEDELVAQRLPRLDALIAEGVTTIEIKSGYGLDRETEAQAAARRAPARRERPSTSSTTFLGAHAVPPGGERQGRLSSTRSIAHDPGARAREAGRCGRRLLRGHRVHARGDRARLRRSAGGSACRSSSTPTSSPTCAARSSGRARRAFGRPSRIHRRGGRGRAWRRPAPSRCCCPAPSTCCARRRSRRSSALRRHGVPMAVATDCNPGTSPLTSLLLAMNMACDAVPPDGRGRPRRRDARGGARARALRRDRHARGRQVVRPRDLGHRAPGRARLPHRLQPASRRVWRGMMTSRRPAASPLAEWRAIYARRRVRLDPGAVPARRGGAAAVARSSRRASRSTASTPASASSPACASRRRARAAAAQPRALARRRHRRAAARRRSCG